MRRRRRSCSGRSDVWIGHMLELGLETAFMDLREDSKAESKMDPKREKEKNELVSFITNCIREG